MRVFDWRLSCGWHQLAQVLREESVRLCLIAPVVRVEKRDGEAGKSCRGDGFSCLLRTIKSVPFIVCDGIASNEAAGGAAAHPVNRLEACVERRIDRKCIIRAKRRMKFRSVCPADDAPQPAPSRNVSTNVNPSRERFPAAAHSPARIGVCESRLETANGREKRKSKNI